MRHALHITRLFLKYRFKGLTSHRGSFLLLAVCQFLGYAVDFALMWIMVTAFGTMNGWSGPEVMILYGVNLLCYSLAGFFFLGPQHEVRNGAHNGNLDDLLIKPVSPLLYLVCSQFQWGYVAHCSLAVVLLVTAFSMLQLSLTVWQVLFFLLSLVCGGMIYSFFFLGTMGLTVLMVRGNNFSGILFLGREFAYYPISIFPQFFRVLLTYVLPYSFINFLPVQVLLGKQDRMGMPDFAAFLSPVIGLALLLLGIWFFRFSLKFYKSSGN